MTFSPSARVLADSVSDGGYRLTTMEVTGHRFILAEFNTHRAFSRNSASSRAIPYAKMRAKALEQTAYPLVWAAEQKGMQGGEELSEHCKQASQALWLSAAKAAVSYADQLQGIGIHKSIINRLLEPFLPHTIIVTATDWDGFWEQRCHPDAQPEIRALAERMREVYDASEPKPMYHGEWHTPLVDDEDSQSIASIAMGPEDWTEITKQLSVARCARVSYLTHEGKRDISADLTLYDRLRNHAPAHASPFEHVATPAGYSVVFGGARVPNNSAGNFTGWHQLRHLEGLR